MCVCIDAIEMVLTEGLYVCVCVYKSVGGGN